MTGGFFAKFYVFSAALQNNLIWLVIIGVLNSAIGAYYYLRIIAVMFMEREKESAGPIRSAPQAAIPALAASTSKRASDRLADTSSTGGATATAQRTVTRAKTGAAVEQAVEKETNAGWITWTALGIAAAGTLAMGTILPFWLVDLAQRAAQMMLK